MSAVARTLGALRDELMTLDAADAESLARGKAVRLALNLVMVDESVALTDGQ